MADEKYTDTSKTSENVSSGGTQTNREVGKDIANTTRDTTAPGVPKPQTGGPEPRDNTPSEGAANKS